MMTSVGLHGVTIVVLLLLPAGALRVASRPEPLDVVFHRPPARVEAVAPLPKLASGGAPAMPSAPERLGPPAPPAGKPLPSPPPPGDPLAPATPDVPPDPGAVVVVEPPRKRVDQTGILAFKGEFASLTQEKGAPRLGRQARYGNADDVGQGGSRTGLATTTPGASGGIDTGSLSRGVGGGSRGGGNGDGIAGVQVGRASSPIAKIGGEDRPLSRGGASPSRTDEEIQIVFDRYKASFYRLYNRELRKDPTLRGQMVLKLTIEPDGTVSMCAMQSSDMNAPDLATQVVDRVRTINFGPKEGVQALTIVYPIDFLPAA